MKISISSPNVEDMLKDGRAVKIELLASTGDGFAERLVTFLSDLAKFAGGGSSRSIGITDASSDEERAIKIFIDGDGADFIRDVKLVEEKK